MTATAAQVVRKIFSIGKSHSGRTDPNRSWNEGSSKCSNPAPSARHRDPFGSVAGCPWRSLASTTHYSWKIVTPLLFETYTRLFAGLTVTKFGYGGTGRTDTSFVFPSITMRLVDMESVT